MQKHKRKLNINKYIGENKVIKDNLPYIQLYTVGAIYSKVGKSDNKENYTPPEKYRHDTSHIVYLCGKE